jgi:branched-chain amino acid transport system substrate-binding protein
MPRFLRRSRAANIPGPARFPVSIAVLILALIPSVLVGCDRSTLPVGFAGPLTGPYSDLGVHGRNGAQLAAEEIDAAGGVAGRRLELRVRDDFGTDEGAIQADAELIRAGVRAIVGHMTSSQSVAAMPQMEAAGMVLLSPTASTPELSGIRDHFFRVQPSTDAAAEALARYAVRDLGLTRMAVVMDMGNPAYAEPFHRHFARTFAALGGSLDPPAILDSRDVPDWEVVALALAERDREGVLVVLSARDLAALAQALSARGLNARLFSSGWAMTEDLLQMGGRTVENIVFSGHTFQDMETPALRAFRERYRARFGHAPSFAAAYAYDALRVLARALERTRGRRAGLPEALTGIRDFPGLHWPISIDEYGDTRSPMFITAVRDGRFVALRRFAPPDLP